MDKFKRPNKHLFIAISILIVINIIIYPMVMKNVMPISELAIFFLFSLNLVGFLLGSIIAIFPYRKLPYLIKQLRISLLIVLLLNALIFFTTVLLFIMSLLGWYNREFSNAEKKTFSDTLLVYDDAGRLRAKGIMINKLKEGAWREFDEKGNIESILNYRNGLVDGHGMVYHPNGKKQLEGDFIKDKKNGHFTLWYPNGNKRNEGDFKNDRPIGHWNNWLEDGTPARDTTFNSTSR